MSSLRAQSAATIGVLFDQFQCFQRLEGFASDTTGSCTPMAGCTTIVTTNSINLGYSADTNGLSEDVSGHGSQPGVVPIFIIRGQLLGDVSLDNVNPFGQLHLAGLFEESGQSLGEDLLVDVFNSDRCTSRGHLD